jgi:WhiB family transcriptional regulator, redox-sensing transcriptional regulator
VLTDDRPPVSSRSVSGLVAVGSPGPRNLGPADYYLSLLYDQVADLSQRPSWHQKAACRGLTTMFFPVEANAATVARAAAVCATCPVTAECEEAAAGEYNGVWSGRLRTRSARRRLAEAGELMATPRRSH